MQIRVTDNKDDNYYIYYISISTNYISDLHKIIIIKISLIQKQLGLDQ